MTLSISGAPVARAQMLIRRPVVEVFEAFADPDVTTQFWFTHGSGRLEAGVRVRWEWEMYGVGADVEVKEVERNRRILVDWGDPGAMTRVEWLFTSRADGSTLVEITNSGFGGTGDEVVGQALDSTGGFTMVLAGLKAWLEHGIRLKLVADHFPGDS